MALSLAFMRDSRLLPGGIAGCPFCALRLGLVVWRSAVCAESAFYVFAWRALGPTFTLKTFCAVACWRYTEVLPHLLSFTSLNPVFAAVSGRSAGG